MICSYIEFISSNEWKQKRLECLERDKICRTCGHDGSLYSLEVHHVKYPDVLYSKNEILYYEWNLDRADNHILLCKECHEAVTSIIRNRRYLKKTLKCDVALDFKKFVYFEETSFSIKDMKIESYQSLNKIIR